MAFGSPQWMYSSGSDYEIDQSLKTNDGDSAYLSWTPSSAGNQRTWTWSGWVKRGELGSNNTIFGSGNGGTIFDEIRFGSDDKLDWYTYASSTNGQRKSTAVFRDASAWYHIIAVYDSTDSTALNRMKLYVNGEQITDLTTTTNPSQNHQSNINNNIIHAVGAVYAGQLYNPYDGYLAEVNFIDGQAKAPADFGETGTYGEWKPVEYSGTYGTNGFYLPFKQDYTVEGFSTVTYKGTGVNPTYIGGTGYRPDLTWIKPRSTADNHVLYDSVRGYNKQLKANAADPEDDNNRVASATDGFTIKTTDGNQNSASHTYVAWNWDMGVDTPTGFGCVTYRGNGTTGQTIGGVGFQPDLVWLKNRTDGDSHFLYDAVRGAKKYLQPDAEGAQATTNQMTAFNLDGFTVDEDGGSATNDDGDNFVAWCWNMGGTNVANTTGSINSTVRANPTYGQSIVSYTGNATSGATIGHGLSSAPEMIIVKNTQSTSNWAVLHKGLADDYETDYIALNNSSNKTDNVAYWNDTEPTNQVFSVGNDNDTNQNSNPLIAYCFHSVSGYSKFGNYTGNGNATGTSVTTGFRPAFLLVRKVGVANWLMFDNVRSDSIVTDIGENLHADYPRSEAGCASAQIKVDFNATGFQWKGTSADVNGNGDTYIYMCFAGGADAVSTVNTNGSIDSRVKANPTYGQSIVSYTGTGANATVGHGLSSAPEMMFIKGRENTHPFNVYHEDIGATYFLLLNSNLAYGAAASNRWNNTAPDSTKFSLGSSANINESAKEMIAYCFHSVAGYSKFGTYVGNGGSNAITTGFEPAFLVIKRSTGGVGGWMMYDNVRGVSQQLQSNSNAAEDTVAGKISFQSTGFTCLINHTETNSSGDNYVYMAFADKREYAYWLDQSGQNNDWTSNNLTESDISVDSPTNNFATLNPLDRVGTLNLKEGNLHYQSTLGMVRGTMAGNANDKFYLEYLQESNINGSNPTMIGIGAIEDQPHHESNHRASVMCHLDGNSQKRVRIFLNNAQVQTTNFDALVGFNAGDILQFAYDGTTGKVWVGRNGNWLQGNPATGTSPIYTFSDTSKPMTAYVDHAGVAHAGYVNFGQDSSFSGTKVAQGYTDDNGKSDFHYQPPSGFLALSSANLKDAGITPSEHFSTLLYNGDGGTQSITGVGFAPDFIWKKARNETRNHYLADRVRGNTKELSSNTTAAEDTSSTYTTFSTDGWSMGATSAFNKNGINYAAFNWKANGSGSANNAGNNNATVSANTDAKFSIVSYTGSGGEPKTVAHGLGVSPEMVIIKKRNNTGSWIVWHKDLADNYAFEGLDTTGAAVSGGSPISKYVDAVSSTLVTLGDASENNNSGDTFIMYCWASVDGYSKVGYYTGNINTNGSFVYTGFKPAFIMLKPSSRSGHWMTTNNKSTIYNPVNKVIFANDSAPEYTNPTAAVLIDYLANGFKLRTNDDNSNGDADTYIYMAFAEVPFKYGNAG